MVGYIALTEKSTNIPMRDKARRALQQYCLIVFLTKQE